MYHAYASSKKKRMEKEKALVEESRKCEKKGKKKHAVT